ncbi:MAG: metallophosphoesterase family protein [Planctomycetes bacterium]|nr:metallophosphoesterase family protein [Planctomycetota bacterium]
MRFGILSDIHANYAALGVVLGEIDELGVDEIVCLGDVIGYYAEPRECLEVIMQRKIPAIRGNHERMVIGEINPDTKEGAVHVIEYTRAQLRNEHYTFIEQEMTNKREHGEHFLMVHGSPRHKDEYLLSMQAFIDNLKLLEQKWPQYKVCFHGHTHMPSVIAPGHFIQRIHEDMVVPLQEGKHYLINPGSVGQPRDGCNRASFAIYDEGEASVYFYRREYDMDWTRQKAREAGFPDRVISRLEQGR